MVEFIYEKFHLPGWRAMNGTYDANNNAWYEEYRTLEQTLGNLDNTLSAFGGAGFHSISEKVDRLWDAFAALAFCRENLEYELFVEIDEKLMKQFGEMTDEFATLDVRNIRTPNVLGIKGINVGYDAEGRAVSETVGGEVNYLTLENFTGAAGFDRIPGYKEQCITGFSKMLENQYDYYVEEGILDRSVKLWEYLNGMVPHEFEYSQYTEVWKKTAHSFLDVLVVPTMVEAVTGVEFITGDHLTDNEQAGKAVQSLIQAVSIGMTAGGAYSKGLTYVTAGKMQSSQISKYAACKVMKSVAEDGVMNMVTTELTERDCRLAAKILMYASLYVGMQETPDFIDRYVENGGLVKSKGGSIPDFYVGPNGKILPSQYEDWIGINIQKELLNQAENLQLKNAIKQLYRENSFIGDGGTADVIRFEQQTGLMLGKNGGSHVQKGIDMVKYIENKILTQNLSSSDRALAIQLLEDLYSALGR